MDGDDELGALLESLEEVDDEVADVLGVGALEGELLLADRDQREGLRERLAAPARERERTKGEIDRSD